MEVIGDFTTSLEKALDEIEDNWRSLEGLIICGSWPGKNEKQKVFDAIQKLKEAKKNNVPVLGICFGIQVIGLERGWKLKKLPERHIGIDLSEGWWGETYESYWHDYILENKKGKKITWTKRSDPYVVGVQFHPEYQSSKEKPHFILKNFIDYAKMAM